MVKELFERVGAAFCLMEPMSRHTSFRIGGPADYFVEPGDVSQLSQIIAGLKAAGTPFYIMGNGSNLLVPDEGYRGVVISLGESFSDISLVGQTAIRACAGALLSKIAHFALQNSLTGFEFAHGIPGSLGGGVYMNAGAYGGELKDVIKRVFYLDEELKECSMTGEEAAFGYRDSIFKHRKYIITAAEIELKIGEQDEIKAAMAELAQKRRDKQPLEYPSAGSTFKRPEGYFAARLIDDCGLKGLSVGGAQVSEKHSGFIVNKGGATCGDVLALIEKVRETVLEKTGVKLETEVVLLK